LADQKYRFIESLTTKKYSAPLTIDKLSDIFQEFYIRAASHIATHISTLSSRLNREPSPAPSRSSASRSSGQTTKGTNETADSQEKAISGQQMLTASEVAERRKARRMLEYKRSTLEDAVERRACESVYDKIWRHRSTLDEVEDEKLRSKTAALSLVGIGLKDLGIDLDGAVDKEDAVNDWLSRARESLAKMSEDRYPLSKLQHLTSAHKAIVDALSNIHPSSSSADEILPTLIYTLISSPPEGINIVSNLNFIQRFRTHSKIDGEAAYCLTNLEAAISFLDNVDLSSLRADEAPEGPPKSSSRPETPTSEKSDPFNMDNKITPSTASTPNITGPALRDPAAQSSLLKSTSQLSLSKPTTPTSATHQRRLSQLLQPSAKAFGAANDAVRNTADQGFKNISSTLDNSFKFLFGRLKEEQMNRAGADASRNVVVPKTLDEARRLVNPPQNLEDASNMSDTSSLAETSEMSSDPQGAKVEDRAIGLIGGRKQTRERSVDSVKSSSSGKKVVFASRSPLQDSVGSKEPAAVGSGSSVPAGATAPNAALDTMRNIGNTLNPLNLGMNVIRGFGRNVVDTPPALTPAAEKSKEIGASAVKQPPAATGIPATEIPKIKAPVKRFLDVKDPSDLRLGEVSELLKDYKRLATALKDLGSF
jgi:hypothetical protein